MGKIVYKIVREEDGRLFSLVAKHHARVEYFVGEWVAAPIWLRAHGYHITAFKTLKHAKNFLRSTCISPDDSILIYKAEAVGIIKNLPPRLSLIDLDWHRIFYKEEKDWYEGTVMCRLIKLLEVVCSARELLEEDIKL